ncbi:MAG TPA: DUF429 domain-containing protein [Rubrivivax sp.]|nr:DUF429 domain-containing protein [Rubrivivax sp.]HPO17705.1 DUF429 domain-containing protein [Rubrivivax sp.]
MQTTPSTALLGVDFTSAPSRRKPITVAHGRRHGGVVHLAALQAVESFAAFEAMLAAPGPWLGAFDFPFGLPREFVESMQLGADSGAVIGALRRRCASRIELRRLVDAWNAPRCAAGQRLPHRHTDRAVPGITSTSPLQTRFVPVAFMYFEGLHRLVAADVHLPGLRDGDLQRTAVEAYPRLLAVELIGRRSYKNDASAARRRARDDMVCALQHGSRRLGLRLQLSAAQRARLLDDASGDLLDAVLCLVQAAWAAGRPRCGLPAAVDALEGWIVTT